MQFSTKLSNTPIQAAIMGAGLMGYWHAQSIRDVGGRVVAVVDRDINAAKLLASHFPEAQYFTEWAKMLASVRPQVLHICTPTPTHVAYKKHNGCH